MVLLTARNYFEILKNIISQIVDEAILNVYSVLSEEKERFIMMNESM